MRIAVASGKGGTGKTTISLNLALYLEKKGKQVTYVDCDVEEPNGHLFLHPSIEHTKAVAIPIPSVDEGRCDGCGKCAEICRFNAIAVISGNVLLFPELCKGCGGCSLVCPQKAIKEIPHEIGIVDSGYAGRIKYIAGRLNIGQASAVPIIREIRHTLPDDEYVILDAPPGTSCPVIETIKGSDVVVLVTEPTPFGLHDLKLASQMINQIGKPHAVILNRACDHDELICEFCHNERIELIGKIPDDRRIAEAYSRGEILICALAEFTTQFEAIINGIQRSLQRHVVMKTNNNILSKNMGI
jgi:MinD superfamily P-loop ATPase